VVVEVPDSAMGFVVGKGAFKIKQMEKTTGAKVKIPEKLDASLSMTRIVIMGSGEAVEAALNELLTIVEQIKVDLTIISVT
jgi:hypothetical protein